MANTIRKTYEHFNKAFKNWDTPTGRYISSKAHYEKVMAEEGMVSDKEADKRGLHKDAKRKEYKVSRETTQLIEAVKQTKGRDGKIHPTKRQIDALKNKTKDGTAALSYAREKGIIK